MRNPATPSFPLPAAHLCYSYVVYTCSVLAALLCAAGAFQSVRRPEHNAVDARHLIVRLWEGRSPAELWGDGEGAFPGRHFWRRHPLHGDSLIQAGILLGAMAAGAAFLAASAAYLHPRRRERLWAFLCLLNALLIFLA